MAESEREVEPNWKERIEYAKNYTLDILKRIWPYVLIGIGFGAWIHGASILSLLMPSNPFAVIAAVLIAIPLYSNAAGTLPIVQALVEKGMPLGTALAFMMAVVAISTPEMISCAR